MRKSFIIHIDSLEVLNELSDEQAGQLFKAISDYQKTGKNNLKGVMSAVFIPFKNQFDRDNQKYESICERNKINGLKGGRPKPKRTQKTQVVISETQNNPKEPDNKNKNDSKNDNDKNYYFNGHVIKINRDDFMAWRQSAGCSDDYFYKVLDERDNWMSKEPHKHKNWFISTTKYFQNLSMAD